MKYILAVFIIVLSLTNTFAQEQLKKGVCAFGGSIYYTSMTTKSGSSETNQSIYAFSPSVDYFFINQVSLSSGISYMVSSTEYSYPTYYVPSSTIEDKNRDLSLNLGFRYYFVSGNITPFIGADGLISWSTPISQSSQPFSPPVTGYAFSGGVSFFIAPTAALEPIVKYSKTRYNEYNLPNRIYVGIGARYFIL